MKKSVFHKVANNSKLAFQIQQDTQSTLVTRRYYLSSTIIVSLFVFLCLCCVCVGGSWEVIGALPGSQKLSTPWYSARLHSSKRHQALSLGESENFPIRPPLVPSQTKSISKFPLLIASRFTSSVFLYILESFSVIYNMIILTRLRTANCARVNQACKTLLFSEEIRIQLLPSLYIEHKSS